MANKQNHFLAQLQAKAELKAIARSERMAEIDTIAFLLAVNSRLKVGPGRADGALNDFLAWKTEIAEEITKEMEEDLSKKKEIIVTRRDLAKRVKEILGPEAWERRKTLFPFLREYW